MYNTYKKIMVVILLFGLFSFLAGCANPISRMTSGKLDNGSVALNRKNFPDSSLRRQIRRFDLNKNGVLSAKELETATELKLFATHRGSGVQEFTGLNLLSNLKKLEISGAGVDYLEFVGFPSLERLKFNHSSYLSLRVADNPNLTELIGGSTKVEQIVVENNPNLTSIVVTAEWHLLSLTITGNTALKKLTVHTATHLTDFVITGSPNVEKLTLWSTQLTELDLTGFPKLQELDCTVNKTEEVRERLTTLDVSNCPDLRVMLARGHLLTALDLTNNPKLEELECYGTMTELDLTNCPNLVKLTCQGDLKELDVSNCRNLKRMYVGGTQLRELDVTNNKKLFSLSCSGNKLERLLFLNSEFENVTMSVSCSFNALPTLDLTGYDISMVMSNQRVSVTLTKDHQSGKITIDLLQLMEQKDLERVEISKEQLEQLGGVFDQQRGIVTLDRLPEPDEDGDRILHYTYDTKNEEPRSDDLGSRYMKVGIVLTD